LKRPQFWIESGSWNAAVAWHLPKDGALIWMDTSDCTGNLPIFNRYFGSARPLCEYDYFVIKYIINKI
jgi:hypothetical protein